jgi:hydrogenase maturation protease
MRTLILGIGNPMLRDDGIGPRIIRELQGRISDPDIVFEETCMAGINLMEVLAGFDNVIIVDALRSDGKPGEVNWWKPHDFELRSRTFPSQHGIGILQALELGKALGQSMPEEVNILAIGAEDITSFGESLTEEVEKAVPVALEQIRSRIASRREKSGAE